MKITTWNIRHGGGSRTEAIKAGLDEVRSSDVLVITEFRPNKNADVICTHLEELGFTHQFRTVEEPKKNGVLVASKTPFDGTMDDALGDHSHRVAVAQFPGLKLFGCYFPQQRDKRTKSVTLFHGLHQLTEQKKKGQKPLFICSV